MNSLHDLWNRISDYCKSSLQEVAYTTWIENLYPVSFRENEIVIKAPSSLHKNLIESHYMTLLHDAFITTIGFDVEIKIISDDEQEEVKLPENNDKENVRSSYTFENFIIGESNKFAYIGAKAVAENPGKRYNPLFIYGDSGLGKTHLLNAIYNEIKNHNPSLILTFTSAESFTNELVNAIRYADNTNFREKYRQTDVLFIDDIHFLAHKESSQEEFFNTFNSLYLNDKQIIITSDRPPKELNTLSERLKTRFESGLIVDIQNPEFETRVAIIKHKAQSYNLEISDEIISYIAKQLTTNVRQLEGIVKKLSAYQQLTGEATSMPIVINSINDIKSIDQPTPLTIEKIISNVEHYYNITPGSLTSSRQTNQISKARQIAMYISRNITNATLDEIGKCFNRDHSSVSYAISQIEEKKKKNQFLKNTINEIITNIKKS